MSMNQCPVLQNGFKHAADIVIPAHLLGVAHLHKGNFNLCWKCGKNWPAHKHPQA